MTEKRKQGRPKAEPTKPVTLRLTESHHAKYLDLGGARWIKRLINEACGKPVAHAKQVTEHILKKAGYVEDMRVVELQPDGTRVMRDPVTMKAYDISTGKEK